MFEMALSSAKLFFAGKLFKDAVQAIRLLAVADALNHRVLIWRRLPTSHNKPADLVIGHGRFDTRDENDGADVAAHSMRWSHGIAAWGSALAVCNAGNNRIMVWSRPPTRHGAPCDDVLGQSGFTACDHNCGRYFPNAAAVNMPYAVAGSHSALILAVADSGNDRVLPFTLRPEFA
jgi:hypothetical protein